MKMLVNVRTSR